MTNQAKDALNLINEKLKTNVVDNSEEGLLELHRINHEYDMIQDNSTKLILGQDVFDAIMNFSSRNSETDYREYGAYFYGRTNGDCIYLTGYTGNDFECSKGLYEGGAVEPTQYVFNEMKYLTKESDTNPNPYNTVMYFHTHPDHVRKKGIVITPASNFFSEQDLYSIGYHQKYIQPITGNKVIYIGGLEVNNFDNPNLNFVYYCNSEFRNIKNIYYIYNNQIYKFNSKYLVENSTIVSEEESKQIKKIIRKKS